MKRSFRLLWTIIIVILTATILSGCGSTVTSGTWYVKGADEQYINFLKDGTAYICDGDTVYAVEWSENDGIIKLEYDSDTLKLEMDGKDTLVSED